MNTYYVMNMEINQEQVENGKETTYFSDCIFKVQASNEGELAVKADELMEEMSDKRSTTRYPFWFIKLDESNKFLGLGTIHQGMDEYINAMRKMSPIAAVDKPKPLTRKPDFR